MWLHLERIWLAFLTCLVLYLVCYGGLIIWHLVNRKSIPVRRLKSIRKTLRRLAPFVFGLVLVAYICTLNVPINFMVIGTLVFLFWTPLKNMAYGLILPVFRKLELGDEILLDGEQIIVDRIGPAGIRGQGSLGQMYVNYEILYENNLQVIKNRNSKKLHQFVLEPPVGLALELAKGQLLEILSNQSLIDHSQLPVITSIDGESKLRLEVYFRGESDPEDLVALLREKAFQITKS